MTDSAGCPHCNTPPMDASVEQIRAWAGEHSHVVGGRWSAIQQGRTRCNHTASDDVAAATERVTNQLAEVNRRLAEQ